MVLELPRASAASVGTGGRRRGVRLPDAGDVPQVRGTRDPGLRVPDFARFAGGLGDIGAGLSDLGAGMRVAADRQQKRHDFNKTTSGLLDVEDSAMDLFLESQRKADNGQAPINQSGFLKGFDARLDALAEKAVTGLDGVSEEAVERFRLNVRETLQGISDSAGRLVLQASNEEADENVHRIISRGAAQADRDPDFVDSILAQVKDRLGEDNPKARQDIILASIRGLVRAKRFLDAELLLTSGKYDDDLTRAQRASAQAMIDAGDRQAVADAEKAEADAEKALKEKRGFRAAELTDGIIEGTVKDPDLDRALRNREIDGKQFIAARKLLKAEEQESALEDNQHLVLDFTQRLEEGALTTAEVIGAFADKQITRATMDRFRNEIDASPDDFRTKEQRRMLADNVGGVSGLGAILGEDATRRVNDAMQEYNERTRGPDKEDSLKVRLDIESRAAAPRTLETLFRPRFMVGPKGAAANKETMDVRETRKATAKALREGKITPAQAAREARLIKDIEAARQRQ